MTDNTIYIGLLREEKTGDSHIHPQPAAEWKGWYNQYQAKLTDNWVTVNKKANNDVIMSYTCDPLVAV